MSRALCLLLCFSSLAFAQTLTRSSQAASSASSPVAVFYAVTDNTTLTTYNIDPQTFEPAAVGTTTLPRSKYPSIVTSPHGQFLYYLAYVSVDRVQLYVYDTDALGVPGNVPVQTTNAGNAGQLYNLKVNPAGTFLYSVVAGPVQLQQQTTQYAIVRNVIDPATGKLSQPLNEATYTLETGSSSNDCYLTVLGFNPAGTILYDGILCSGPHGSGSGTYNQRSVDLQTGALGPDQQVYYYSIYAGSSNANLQMQNNLMFAFVANFNQGPNADLVDVYQLPNTSPTVNCTASMWAVCGDSGFALAHPSGKYVFLEDSNGLTDIGQVNSETQQIVQVNSLPYVVEMFSPDGTIAYGPTSAGPGQIHIAGFNSVTGQVTPGGSISLIRVDDYWVSAERY
jgi:hypothetical protein